MSAPSGWGESAQGGHQLRADLLASFVPTSAPPKPAVHFQTPHRATLLLLHEPAPDPRTGSMASSPAACPRRPWLRVAQHKRKPGVAGGEEQGFLHTALSPGPALEGSPGDP